VDSAKLQGSGPLDSPELDLLITGGDVFTLDPQFTVVRGGSVGISEGKIAGIWSRDDMPQGTACEVLDVTGSAVLPGIVNAHTHIAGCVFRGVLEDYSGSGLYDVAFPFEQRLAREDIALLARLGIAEVLRGGCTTINDIYYYPDILASVIEETGMRAILANKVFDAELPLIAAGKYERNLDAGRQRLSDNAGLIEKWNGRAGGRITCRVGAHATDTCSRSLLKEAGQLAEQSGVGLHIHVAQSSVEVDYTVNAYGRSPVHLLGDLELLGPSTVVVHCTWVDDDDITLLATSDTHYVCCPVIYPRRGYFPPLQKIVSKGIITGFGTDWIRMDPWDGMRQAVNAVRMLTRDPRAISAQDVLSRSTREAAKTLGLDKEIGSLQVGKKADVIVVNLQQSHIQPFYGAAAGLVYTVGSGDISTVVVDGVIIVREGRCLTVDLEGTLREVARRVPGYAGAMFSKGPPIPATNG
jgi:5-methylthioadenosine/S-adenosylhomocysteine deaminase